MGVPFFSGAKSNKVRSILSGGYVQCKSARFYTLKQFIKNGRVKENGIYNATLNLEKEASKGSSYYGFELLCGRWKSLKTFFCFRFDREGFSKNLFLDAKVLRDSRGSCFDVNLARSVRWYKSCQTPAYLVVFEIDERDC